MTSKHGVPHVRAAIISGSVDVPTLAEAVMATFNLSDEGKVSYRAPVEATNQHDLAHQQSKISLGPNEHFVGFVRRGDAAALGIPPLADAFPNGAADNQTLKVFTYKALVLALTGKLQLSMLHQADNNAELHALHREINLTAHDDAFLGFVRTEH